MNNKTMIQYLLDIKALVDIITSTGRYIDDKDITLYILNRLPTTYHAFEATIHNKLYPINFDDLLLLVVQ